MTSSYASSSCPARRLALGDLASTLFAVGFFSPAGPDAVPICRDRVAPGSHVVSLGCAGTQAVVAVAVFACVGLQLL